MTNLYLRFRHWLNGTWLAGWLRCVSGEHEWILHFPDEDGVFRHRCRRCLVSVPDDRVWQLWRKR